MVISRIRCSRRTVSALLSSIIPLLALAGVSAGAVPALSREAVKETRWVVYYGTEVPPEAFEPYDLVVLESFAHPPLQPLKDRGKTVLGYLSVGEIESGRSFFGEFESQNLMLGENPNWPGSYSIDIRDPRWTKKLVEELIPEVLHRGFDGIFLDTLDNPADLERRDPAKYAGMTPAAAKMVRTIRRNHPGIKIMINRAYEILPEIGGHIDYVLGESVYAGYDFANKTPVRTSEADYAYQVRILTETGERYPNLEIMSLDYWDPADTDGVAEIYAVQRANGFSPYVATVDLNRIVEEPGR